MKIRFYHMLVYRLYYWVWTPLLKQRPDIVEAHIRWMQRWLENRKSKP